ncbi:MAG: sigma 54-interacting transcriptional regulator [Balneolaceae bacterium]
MNSERFSTSPFLQARLETDFVEESPFYTKSKLMEDIYNKVKSISGVDKHVVLIGEIGSGKKRFAKIIHAHSRRSGFPFYSFYCVDINEATFREAFWEHIYFEGEHIHLRYDVLEKASGGSLFLDQFSELSPQFMVNMLNSYSRGVQHLFRYNPDSSPRVILSISQVAFRNLSRSELWTSLLDSLDPVCIMLPPLRERREDIPDLVEQFLAEARSSDPEWKDLKIDPSAIEECLMYEWPGNVRQLKNAILHGAILSHGKVIEERHLPFSMKWKLPYNL